MARSEALVRVVASWVLVAGMTLAGAGAGAGAPAAPTSADGLGSVSGVVTADGTAQSAAWVVLTPVTETGEWAGKSEQAATDLAGRYAFVGLPAGHVKLRVRAPLVGDFVATYWPGVYSFGQAGVIPVTSQGFVADIDLPGGRSISGRVIAEDTGEPVEGAQLVARIAGAPWSDPAGRSEPGGAPGTFKISGLPPVAIRLHVQVPPSSPFLGDGYWSDGSESGRRVVSPGDVTGLVIRLPRGGELSGTVRDAAGHPVPGASVRIEKCQFGCPRDLTTDKSGAFLVRGVAPTSGMVVHAWAPGMLDQWFDRANEWVAATPLSLGAGEARSGVDFVLVSGGMLIGQVLAGDTGMPLPAVPAYLQAVADPSRKYSAYFVRDDPDHYRIGPVPPGTYRLVLLPSGSQTPYRPARWMAESGIAHSGIVRIDPGRASEVVVTLSRTQPASSQCSETANWLGLFRGFLGPQPWPPASRCAPAAPPPASASARSA